jgi:hypothetical protein
MRITISVIIGDIHKTITIDEFGETLTPERLKAFLIAEKEASLPALPPATGTTA